MLTLLVTAASLFSAETQDVSPFTSPGNSHIRAEEPKPPVFETPSWTISDRGDSSANVADSANDLAAFEHTRRQGRAFSPLPRDLGPLQRSYDMNQHQHDPVFDDTPHADLTPMSAQGTPHSSASLPDPSGRKPTLHKIQTNTQLETKNSDSSPGTAFYTPGASGEIVERNLFDSAVNIRAVYSSGSSSRSRNVAGGTGRVVEVCQPTNEWKSKYQFPTQALHSPRTNSNTTEDTPGYGSRTSWARLSQVTGERRRDSAFSFSSSPFDEFRRDADSSRRISEVNTSTFTGWGSGPRPKSKLSAGGEGDGIQGSKKITFPGKKGERMVPKLDGGEDGDGEDRRGKGKEGDDHSCISASAEYVSVSREIEEHPRVQDQTPVSPAQLVTRYTT